MIWSGAELVASVRRMRDPVTTIASSWAGAFACVSATD
jgi:hypothetical protein